MMRLRRWYAGVRYRRRIHEIAAYWHSQGATAPYSAAAEESYLRNKLEDFREFASKRYLEDRSLPLDDIKQEWLDLVVAPMAGSEFTRGNAKALKAAIASIPHSEAFVGKAEALQKSDINHAIAEAKAGRVYTGRTA